LKNFSPYQFSFLRIILGAFLVIHFLYLIPNASIILDRVSFLSDTQSDLVYGCIPNLLSVLESPLQIQLFIGVLAVLALLFLLGFQRQIVSLFLCYGWACLFDGDNLIYNPGIPFIGLILFFCILIPKGEPLAFAKNQSHQKWQMPLFIFIGAWVLMSIAYLVSGIYKFQSSTWRDGSAILNLAENPFARDWWLRDWFLDFPELIIKLKAWTILTLEIIFLPLAIFKTTRKWIWLLLVGMHLGMLLLVDFSDISMGWFLIHAFTFDGRWLKPKPKQSGVVFFDGVCSVCNGFVDFLISNDTNDSLQYAALQGEAAQEQLPPSDLKNVSTIIYKSEDKIYKESDAALKAIASIGGIWKLAIIFRLVPRFIRDNIYRYIARNRYNWFGKKDVCRMPTPEERNKILS